VGIWIGLVEFGLVLDRSLF